MTLRDELLHENHGDAIEAAAILAVRLNRDDPNEPTRDGYTIPNAVLAAKDIFPEVDESDIRGRAFAIRRDYSWITER
jgi:hypothetical protein